MTERQYEGGQIEFHFEYDPGYRLIAANGVWGEPTPRGDLRLDFFVEAPTLPTRVMHAISPEGQVGTELRREPERRFTRRIQLGILVSMDHAESIARTIQDRVTEYRSRGATRHEPTARGPSDQLPRTPAGPASEAPQNDGPGAPPRREGTARP